ncbi:MAG TPA: flavodoxin family protein [Clostridia bacterium]
MKILAINSSFRGDNGCTKFLIDKILEGAAEKKAECENVNLVSLKINRCTGCRMCQSKKHYLKCIHDDDAQIVFSKMKEADIIIFATPIYVLGISSLLKTLLERMYSTCKMNISKITDSGLPFHHIDKDLSSKPFVFLITCDNPSRETTKAAETFFKTYAKFTDSRIAGMLIRRTCALIWHWKNSKSEKTFSMVSDICDAYIQAGRELADTGTIKPQTQRKVNKAIINVPPFFKQLIKLDFVKKRVEKVSSKIMNTPDM